MTERIRFSEFWFLYSQAFRQMRRLSLWMPLLLYGLLALILAFIHFYIFSPITGPLVSAWVKLIKPSFAQAFFHYPAHFVLYSMIYNFARIALSIVLEALIFGVVIDMLIALYNNRKPVFMTSFSHALKRYFALTVVWAIMIVIQVLVGLYFNNFIENVVGLPLQASPRRLIAADIARGLVAMLIYAPFVFVLPSVMQGTASWGRAIIRGISMTFRHPFVSFGLVFIPFFLIGFIPNWISSQTDKIVNNFFPEMVFYLAIAVTVLDIILYFVFLGTSVKFFMDHHDE